MVTSSDIDSARSLILQTCFEIYEKSPTAWAIWQQLDAQAHDALDRAARSLQVDGLIAARYAADRTIVHAQLTVAGVNYMKSILAHGQPK